MDGVRVLGIVVDSPGRMQDATRVNTGIVELEPCGNPPSLFYKPWYYHSKLI